MNFIQIANHRGETVAINPLNITSVKTCGNTVVLCLGADTINTNFESLPQAVNFFESVSESFRSSNWREQ